MADDKKVVPEEEKAVFLKSTAARYLEEQEERSRLTPKELAELDRSKARDFTGDGNDTSAYVGVSPEYMNYANESDKPLWAGEDSAVGRLEAELTKGGAVAEVPDPTSNQTEGGGSTVPLVYAEFSGSDFQNRVVSVDEAEAERKRLDPEVKAEAEPKKDAPKVATKTAASNKSGS